MNIVVSNEKGVCRISMDGELSIYSAADTKQKMLEAMEACAEIEMNLSHVSEIDSAGMQLLALAKREAAERGKKLHFVAHSKAVLELLDLCDLAGVFGDPVVMPR